jgi:HK97 family phage prohead protease
MSLLDAKAEGARLQRAFALEVRAVGDAGEIEGYGSVFGVKDSYDDVILPGAFKASLREHSEAGTMPALLWQHRADEPIGVWTAMSEDEQGLKVSGRLALDTERGREAHALLKMGALNGLSIGFFAREWTYDRGTEVRTLTQIELWEVSLVTFPANGKARVTGVKSVDEIDAPKDAEKALREAGFSKADATAFVARVMRMGEERREAAQSAALAQRAADRLLATLTFKD